MDGLSMDLEATNQEKLKAVFPECFAEGKLDIDKLLSLCGEYTEDDFEKYEFKWAGKAQCLKLAQQRSNGSLRPCRVESVDFDNTQNLYIEGDNLEVLKLLQRSYYRQVKMIYIDPPYNTGNDFVYKDDFKDPLARYKEITSQATKSNPETMGRFHTNWLNMIYPRIRLAANLLRDDGVIFISIDDNEVDNLKKVCNEAFGEENFVAQIVWKSKLGKIGTTTTLSTTHEYILCYAKNIANITFAMIEKENDGRKENLRQWGQADRREDRPSMYYPITINGITVYPIKEDGTDGRWRVGQEMANDLLQKGMLELVEKNGKFSVYRNFEAGITITPYDTLLIDDIGTTATGTIELRNLEINKCFDYPKPVSLVKRLLQLVCPKRTKDKDLKDNSANYAGTKKSFSSFPSFSSFQEPPEIILDFFSGSGTTAHAVMQLNAEDGGNRHFICVQLPELCDEKSEAYKAGYKNICEIGKERIRRAGSRLADNSDKSDKSDKSDTLELFSNQLASKTSLDTGFKVLKLDSSNFKTWDSSYVSPNDLLTLEARMNDMIDRIKPSRTNEDVIYEVMLKLGVSLTESITEIEIDGVKTYSIGEECLLLICFEPNISSENLEAMAEYAPAQIVLKEDCLEDDSALSNAHYILEKHHIGLKLL